jgi:DHA2 family multidrug resistance protein
MSAPGQAALRVDATSRRMITFSVMAATIMNSLDTTIANVALPHIQGSVSASQDQITWVLTSYIVAAAIMTPMTGWLAGRFGQRRVLMVSIVGFTIASGLCGVAQNLGEIVGFRLLQGVFGAALIPSSQAVLLDINPPERHGQAMSIWVMGAILGPILGPGLGGWLTDNLTWRWVFYINLPIGLIAFFGISTFLHGEGQHRTVKLDFVGFATLGLAIGSLQMMLDRGQQLDWFSSREIGIEAGLAGLFLYLFLVQTFTAKQPFINPRLFLDRNFLGCSVIGFVLGTVLFAVLSLLPPMLENLMGYPVVTTGLVTMPRGIGTLLSTILVGRLVRKVDNRLLMAVGLALSAVSLVMMSHMSLLMDERVVLLSGFVQGCGTGMVFVPLSTMAFATLDQRFRAEGTAMFTLIRNIGASIGISSLQVLSIRNTEIVHSRLTEGLRPDNPAMANLPARFSLTDPGGIAALNGEISRQAAMVSYVDAFWFLSILSGGAILLLLLVRKPKRAAPPVQVHME